MISMGPRSTANVKSRRCRRGGLTQKIAGAWSIAGRGRGGESSLPATGAHGHGAAVAAAACSTARSAAAGPSTTPPIPLLMHTGGSISTSGVHQEGYGRGSGEAPGVSFRCQRGGAFRCFAPAWLASGF